MQDNAESYNSLRLQPSYEETRGGAMRQDERKIVPESFQKQAILSTVFINHMVDRASAYCPAEIRRGERASRTI
jgi:hypothetical protein